MSSRIHIHDILNTSDHLLDVSSEHESLTHHPSLISAYESELQFDDSTFQHETEPYRSQVVDSTDRDGTSGGNTTDRGDNSHTDLPDDPLHGTIRMKEDDGVFSSSPVDGPDNASADSEDDDDKNPYKSYQQFHRDLSSHDDPKSDLMEFETLEQENTDTATPEVELTPFLGQLASLTNITGDVPSLDSLRSHLPNNQTAAADSMEMGLAASGSAQAAGGKHKSRRDHWVDNSISDVSSISKQGNVSPSRIPKPTSSPVRSQPTTPNSHRSRTPTGIPTMRKSKSQSLTRERSPSATRRSPAGGEERSGRRSVSADTKTPPLRSSIPSTVVDQVDVGRRHRIMSASMIPRSRPMTPSSSLRSLDRQSSPEPRSELSETGSSRPASRLPKRSKGGSFSSANQMNPSSSSVEPRMFQNQSNKPSRLPSARHSVTSATELTSQDEQSPDLDLSSEEEGAGLTGSPGVHINDSYGGTFLTQPNNSVNIRNPSSSDTQPLSTMVDTHDQFTSMTDRSTTEAPQPPPPKFKNTKVTTKTTLDYEEIETTKTTTRILSQSPSARGDDSEVDKAKQRSKSLHNASRLRQAGRMLERRALSESRTDSPSQFGEAKALNDAIRLLEARETKDNKSSTEKSTWSPTLPEDMGDNSRPLSSTWTSLAEYDQSRESKANSAVVRPGDVESVKRIEQSTRPKEDMPRTSHTHLPGAVNHAHYALPTTSYLSNCKTRTKGGRLQSGRADSSSSDVVQVPKKRSPRKKRVESDQSAARNKPDHSDLTLDTSTREDETESEELVRQLQTDFDDLLSKYAMAEVTIDQLRLGAKLNFYSEPSHASQAALVQPSTARSATTLTLPHKGQASLNSSLQSCALGYSYPGMSPRQAAESGILTTSPPKPLSLEQKALTGNIIHLQDQVASFIAGVSGEGRILNLKPEIHHQLYEALEQSQDTLHHQLNEEKRQDPSFDQDNQLAGQLHQIRMCMDEHIDKLPQVEQPSRLNTKRYNSEDETMSQTPSSLDTGHSVHSGSTSVHRPKRSQRHSKRNSRQVTPQGTPGASRMSPSYTDRSTSADDDMLTDDETVRPRAHQHAKDGASDGRLKPQPKGVHGAASNSSVAGSDHTHGIKSRTRLQGSSDSGFIGSEEGKSPNTPSDRHLSGLPTIQSQAENSGIDTPRALTPDLSESRTAEWALRHKVPIEVGSEPVLSEPPNAKRGQSRSSRKSVRSERSGQSSLKSEALRSMKSEIGRLRDDFNLHQPSSERHPSADIPKHSFGSPMKATYQLPAGYQSHSPLRTQATNNKADPRNSDLDLSEVEGGRGFTPAPPARLGNLQDYYPSTDEDPRQPMKHSEKQQKQQQQQKHRADLQPYSEQMPLQQELPYREVEYDHRVPNNRPGDQRNRPDTNTDKHPNIEMTDKGRITSPLQDYLPPSQERRRHPEYGHPRRPDTDDFSGRSPSSPYDHRPYDKRSFPRQDEQPVDYRQDSPAYSDRRPIDEPDYRGYRSDRGQRPAHRGDMSPISEQTYTSPEREYYRRYKSPLRRSQSYREDKHMSRPSSRTMDELHTRDLNQTTLPLDSTVYTNQSRTPNIAPPNAISTPYHPQQPAIHSHSHYQSQVPLQQINQSEQPLQHGSSQPHPPSQTFTQQPAQMYHQSDPVQRVPVQPPYYQQQPVTSYPLQQPSYQQPSYQQPSYQQPSYQQPSVTSLPVQQQVHPTQSLHQTAVIPTGSVVPATAVTYQTCSSCAGKGILAACHSCTMCGSQLKPVQQLTLTNSVTPVHLSNSASVAVANQNTPVVIPVANEKHSQAFLTQETADGYLTQSVNVVESADNPAALRSHSPVIARAVPVLETSPSGKVRYYVREYGAIASDEEPRRSRSHSRHRRSKSSDRYKDVRASESMDDLESSLREARKSAESLKRFSKGMRDGLHDELMRSLHRRSLTSSWNL